MKAIDYIRSISKIASAILVLRALTFTATAHGAQVPRERLETYVGETSVMRFNHIKRIAVGNPEIADVAAFPDRPDEMLLTAKKPGVTTLSVWDASATGAFHYEVAVSDETSRLDTLTYQFKYYDLHFTEIDREANKVTNKTKEENVKNLQAVLTPLLGDRFSVDSDRNRVTLQGTAEELAAAGALLKEIDKPLRQVEIEARVVEMTTGDIKALGAYMTNQYKSKGYSINLDNTAPLEVFDTFYDVMRSFLHVGFQNVKQANAGKLLVNPKITVLDGNYGTVFSGQTVPVPSRDQTGQISYQYVDVGIILNVWLKVADDDTIAMWVRPTVSRITGWAGDPTNANSAAPVIDTREAFAEVRVKNGEEFAIGGLVNEQETTENSKVPLLGDLPGVGSFFRKKRREVSKTELVIFITPRIVGETEVQSSKLEAQGEPVAETQHTATGSDTAAIDSNINPASDPVIIPSVIEDTVGRVRPRPPSAATLDTASSWLAEKWPVAAARAETCFKDQPSYATGMLCFNNRSSFAPWGNL